ncbi:hypothetical protein GCK32_012903 [Trichostrongylus colubriformis]|uniref:Uncharacterized protein n=1 Tax=Trichostrongylus colubriformis TaxID=6319 RepID=A0AAN8FHW5_TRICO
MDASNATTDQELMWDSHADEDLGDLLDFIMKNTLPTANNFLDGESIEETVRVSESISTMSQDSFSLDDVEWVPHYTNSSLLRKIQTVIDLQPGFVCLDHNESSSESLSEIIRRQLIMDEVRAKLDASTRRVYARRHGRDAAARRESGPSLFVPRRRGVEMPPSYLALIEKMNPILFDEIHFGEVHQLPIPPDDISYLYRLGQFIDIFERVLLSEPSEYHSEEAYVLQAEYDRVYDSLFTNSHSMTILGDGQH